jgi:NagD protein
MTTGPAPTPAPRSWLIDMDGVLVHEDVILPGADRVLAGLRERGAPFLVLTNNSLQTARDLAARLRTLGLEVPENSIWTSALATANFLASQRPRRARPRAAMARRAAPARGG